MSGMFAACASAEFGCEVIAINATPKLTKEVEADLKKLCEDFFAAGTF